MKRSINPRFVAGPGALGGIADSRVSHNLVLPNYSRNFPYEN